MDVVPASTLHRPTSALWRWLDRPLGLAFVDLYLAYTFIGVSPMTGVDGPVTNDGNGSDRLALCVMASMGVVLIALRARTGLRLIRRSWALWLLLGWFAVSPLWSAHPDIAVRRLVAETLLVVACLAAANSLRSMSDVHAAMIHVIAVTIAANIAVTVVSPGFSYTDIGVRGFYAQKNVAGVVGLISVIVVSGWLLRRKSHGSDVLGVALLTASGAFLWLTQSKTSLSLALLGLGCVSGLVVARWVGWSRALVAAAFAAALILCALGLALAFDVDVLALALPGGDTSFTGRSEIWDLAHAEIARRPWTGYGYGSFWDVGPDDDPLSRAAPGTWLSQVKLGADNVFIINEAHNGFLDLRLQGGLPALVLALLFLAQIAWRLLNRAFRPGAERSEAVAAMTFATITVVFLMHNLTESSLWFRGQIFFHFWLLVAFCALACDGEHASPRRRRQRPGAVYR